MRPPRIKTTEYWRRLCPIPGMYASTFFPVDNFTFATFLKAELGFLGVRVKTFKQTPRRCGLLLSAGVLTLKIFFFRACFIHS